MPEKTIELSFPILDLPGRNNVYPESMKEFAFNGTGRVTHSQLLVRKRGYLTTNPQITQITQISKNTVGAVKS